MYFKTVTQFIKYNLIPIAMKSKNGLLTILFAGTVLSCTYENPDTLTANLPVVTQATYIANIKPIMDNNCVSCHAQVPINGAPMPLVNYMQVKNAVLNQGLINRIMLENGNGLLMPQGGPRMPQTVINLVQQWQQDGLLE
jgi:hypothetical protein